MIPKKSRHFEQCIDEKQKDNAVIQKGFMTRKRIHENKETDKRYIIRNGKNNGSSSFEY